MRRQGNGPKRADATAGKVAQQHQTHDSAMEIPLTATRGGLTRLGDNSAEQSNIIRVQQYSAPHATQDEGRAVVGKRAGGTCSVKHAGAAAGARIAIRWSQPTRQAHE